MKKDLLFSIPLIIIGALLALLRYTGMPAHIAISVLGVVLLIVYTVKTKKEWRIPALEILMRLCYGIALISGVVLMNVQGILALSIAHKVAAALFLVIHIALSVRKVIIK